MPASDRGDDFVGVGDPLERLGLGVVIFQEAVDRSLEIDQRVEGAALWADGWGGEEGLDRTGQEQEVGVM